MMRRAEMEARSLLLPIKEIMVNLLARALETGIAGWEFVKPLLVKIGENVSEGVTLLEELIAKYVDPLNVYGFKKIIEDLKNQRAKEAEPDAGIILEWLNAANNLGRDWSPKNAGDEAQRKMAGPIFRGS